MIAYMQSTGKPEKPTHRVPVLCPGEVNFGGFRWQVGPKNPGISLVFGSHNAEVEGSSPSLTTIKSSTCCFTPSLATVSARDFCVTPVVGVLRSVNNYERLSFRYDY